jgi:L-lactate dehydrogenase
MVMKRVAGKVGLVGTGMVGSSFAYALTQRGLATELVLVDLDGARAEGEAMDLNHGLPFVRPMTIRAGGYEDLAGAEVVVLAGGANQRPGETRIDLLNRNAAVFRDMVPKVVASNPDGLIVIATNPVDILTHLSVELARLPRGRVIGSGTILDTARFRYLLGDYYNVDPRSVHAYIVGEHGDTELALWSTANVAGIPLRSFVSANGKGYDQTAMDTIFEQTRTAAYEIIKRKKATYYAIGLGLLTIVEAVLRDQKTVLTVSSPMTGQYGVEGMSISLPSVVGREGVEQVLTLPMSEAEVAAFRQSAQTLQERWAQAG